jgi:hypothetical protein
VLAVNAARSEQLLEMMLVCIALSGVVNMR